MSDDADSEFVQIVAQTCVDDIVPVVFDSHGPRSLGLSLIMWPLPSLVSTLHPMSRYCELTMFSHVYSAGRLRILHHA